MTASTTTPLSETLANVKTSGGKTLAELSDERPLLVVLLRHSGCAFCRETLSDLAARRAELDAAGVGLALVHLGDDAGAAELAARYGLADIPRVADPERRVYEAFELPRGNWLQVIGPRVFWRGMTAALAHGFGGIQGDVWQLPGVFLIHHGQIIRGYRHDTSADRPDYLALAGANPAACPLPRS